MIASIHDAGEAFWGATEVFLLDSGMTLRQNRLRVGMELLGRVMAEGRDLLKALSLSPFSWRATAGVGLGPTSCARVYGTQKGHRAIWNLSLDIIGAP